METAEQKESPAQLQITLPKKDKSSWLINAGVSYRLGDNATSSISKIATEYHKNTLTDKEQDNFSIGYGLTQLISKNASKGFFINGDAKYVYDGVENKNSIVSNMLLTYYKNRNGGPGFNFNSRNICNGTALFVSAYTGLQLQGAFKASDNADEGFILRPQFKTAIHFDINKKDDPITPSPLLRFSADYSGRVDAINTTDNRENYTHLIKTGADIFIAYQPIKVSIGGSFNYGSNPVVGLKQQEFWLVSLNIMK
ncbi:hypothetical protein BV902_12965 [Sphingobacterium sp. B29]|nr:hypothetical protein BV902_12965 [Sphingobacterium sp. B29]